MFSINPSKNKLQPFGNDFDIAVMKMQLRVKDMTFLCQ